MENATSVVAPGFTADRGFGLRLGAVVAALALVFAMLVLLQSRADATPTGSVVAASVAGASVSGASAQVNFNQIFCSTLLAVRNAFANSPFFAFIQPVIDALLAQFGCVISGT